MNYAKPEITSLASASLVVQATTKGESGSDTTSQYLVTISAYEADE